MLSARRQSSSTRRRTSNTTDHTRKHTHPSIVASQYEMFAGLGSAATPISCPAFSSFLYSLIIRLRANFICLSNRLMTDLVFKPTTQDIPRSKTAFQRVSARYKTHYKCGHFIL